MKTITARSEEVMNAEDGWQLIRVHSNGKTEDFRVFHNGLYFASFNSWFSAYSYIKENLLINA